MFWRMALVLAMLGGSGLQLYYYLIALCVCVRVRTRVCCWVRKNWYIELNLGEIG